MFKKREVKGNIRKKDIESRSSDGTKHNKEEEEDEVDFNALSDVKDRQLQRKRTKHEFTELQNFDENNLKSHKKSDAVKSIEGVYQKI